jgi:hypothetical protein
MNTIPFEAATDTFAFNCLLIRNMAVAQTREAGVTLLPPNVQFRSSVW